MINIDIIFDHKKKYKNGGPAVGPVEVRIIYQRKAYYIGTGVRVHYSNFVAGSVVGQVDAKELNERLRLIYTRVQAEVNKCIEDGAPIYIADIRRKVRQIDMDSRSDGSPLLDWIEERMGMLNLRDGTMKHYRTLLVRLHEYGELRRWQDVTVDGIFRFDAWLHSLKKIAAGRKVTDVPMTDSAVYNYHKCLKALLNYAVKVGVLDANPYDRLRGEFKRGESESVEYLTEEEMQRFVDTKPPMGTEMDVAHDLFVFQMYTGLSYSDMQAFDIKDYKREVVNGKERWVNVGERVKTGVAYISQLLPPAVEVLRKYDWRIPSMANSKYNICLKALGMVAGIDQPLHSHLARHTFATWMLRHEVPIEHVAKMLGHTNIRQTQRYAKVQAVAIHEDFDRMGELLKKKN